MLSVLDALGPVDSRDETILIALLDDLLMAAGRDVLSFDIELSVGQFCLFLFVGMVQHLSFLVEFI